MGIFARELSRSGDDSRACLWLLPGFITLARAARQVRLLLAGRSSGRS